MLARVLAASALVTWPALFAAGELPSEGGPLGGKGDDFVVAVVIALLVIGLLAAGWLGPLWAMSIWVVAAGLAVPVLYEVIRPTVCRSDVSGMDCPSAALAVVFTVPALLLVLLGSGVRRVAGHGRS